MIAAHSTSVVARWRVALRLARRTMLRAKIRTVLTVVMIALPVTAITFLAGAYASTLPSTGTTIDWLMGDAAQARLWTPVSEHVQHLRQNASGDRREAVSTEGPSQATTGEAAAQIPDGDRVVPGRQAAGSLAFGDKLVRNVGLYEVDTAEVPGLVGEVSGDARPGRGNIVLREAVAERLGAAAGDTVSLVLQGAHVDVQVVGVGASTTPYSGVLGPGTLPDSEVDRVWWVVGVEPVTWSDVEALNSVGFLVQSRAVLADPPPSEEVYDGQFDLVGDSHTSEMEGLAYAAVGLGLLEVVLLVGPAFAVGAKRSARSLALISAMGGRAADLRRVVLAQGLVAGLAAGVLGVTFGTIGAIGWYVIMSRQVEGPVNLTIPVSWPLGAAALAVLLGAAAAYLPARTAAKADVVAILAGRTASVPRRAAWTWFGLILAGVGTAAALLAAFAASPMLLVVGVTVVVIGFLFAAGALVDVAGRLADKLRLAGRFALRDAARHRGRTAPAVAAVLATMTVAVAGLIGVASDAAARAAVWAPIAANGTGLVAAQWNANAGPMDLNEEQIRTAVQRVLPQATVAPIRHLLPLDPAEAWGLWPEEDPAAVAARQSRCDADPSACEIRDGRGSLGFTFESQFVGASTLVDDGTMIARTGRQGAQTAAEALTSGKVLIGYPGFLWPDGSAHLKVAGPDGRSVGAEIILPAHLVPWPSTTYGVVISPQVAQQITDQSGGSLTVRTDGALVTGAQIDDSAVDRLDARLGAINTDLRVWVEGKMPAQTPDPRLAMTVLLAAVITAILAVAVTVSLAAADMKPDMATLGAVGATGRTRRRIGAAQGAVIAVIGTIGGLIAGIPVGYLITAWRASNSTSAVGWQLAVPVLPILTLAIAIPLIGAAVGAAITRPRLPLRSRVTQF